MRRAFLAAALICVLAASGCRAAPRSVVDPAPASDSTPRVVILSAFERELTRLRKEAEIEQVFEINGRSFYTGTLAGREVVLALSGTSMVNAAMNTQVALDHFNAQGVVFSGIAGGVNPQLGIGDVVVPAQWGQYQEQLFAREKDGGWDTGFYKNVLGNYGMMFPQYVSLTRSGGQPDREEQLLWFPADEGMLDAAGRAGAAVELENCTAIKICLDRQPQVKVGGSGVSGQTFVDNADYRAWVWQTFQADALDMESAAAAHVAYANGVPFIAFRSLSDLAGGGAGENELLVFFELAADNSAAVVLRFLEEWR